MAGSRSMMKLPYRRENKRSLKCGSSWIEATSVSALFCQAFILSRDATSHGKYSFMKLLIKVSRYIFPRFEENRVTG